MKFEEALPFLRKGDVLFYINEDNEKEYISLCKKMYTLMDGKIIQEKTEFLTWDMEEKEWDKTYFSYEHMLLTETWDFAKEGDWEKA